MYNFLLFLLSIEVVAVVFYEGKSIEKVNAGGEAWKDMPGLKISGLPVDSMAFWIHREQRTSMYLLQIPILLHLEHNYSHPCLTYETWDLPIVRRSWGWSLASLFCLFFLWSHWCSIGEFERSTPTVTNNTF